MFKKRLNRLQIEGCISIKHVPNSSPNISEDLQLLLYHCPTLENFAENRDDASSKFIFTLYVSPHAPVNAESVEKIHKML